jgi:hypothetical protein
MEFDTSSWLNTDTMTPVYGVTVKTDKGKFNVAEKGKPLFYDTEEAAQKKADELNQQHAAQIAE